MKEQSQEEPRATAKHNMSGNSDQELKAPQSSVSAEAHASISDTGSEPKSTEVHIANDPDLLKLSLFERVDFMAKKILDSPPDELAGKVLSLYAANLMFKLRIKEYTDHIMTDEQLAENVAETRNWLREEYEKQINHEDGARIFWTLTEAKTKRILWGFERGLENPDQKNFSSRPGDGQNSI